MKKLVYTITLASLLSCAANVMPGIGSSKCLSNSDVTYMSNNNVGTDVILTSINNTCCRCFVTTPDALIDLKSNGVADIVIKRMIQLNNPKLVRPVNTRANGPGVPVIWK